MIAIRIAGAILTVGSMWLVKQENDDFFVLVSLGFLFLGLLLMLNPEMIVGLFTGKRR